MTGRFSGLGAPLIWRASAASIPDDWHREHLNAPKPVCRRPSCRPIRGWPRPSSTLPISTMTGQATLGVPYTAEMTANAQADVKTARRARRGGPGEART
jgi:cbb3-type cytochrome oxidase cytochrome c subunit